MYMHNLNFFLKKLIAILLIFIINFSFSYADPLTIKKIIVSGEKRLSKSFILNFLPTYPNTKFNDEVLNQFTKDLYNTGLFSDVNLEIKKDIAGPIKIAKISGSVLEKGITEIFVFMAVMSINLGLINLSILN